MSKAVFLLVAVASNLPPVVLGPRTIVMETRLLLNAGLWQANLSENIRGKEFLLFKCW